MAFPSDDEAQENSGRLHADLSCLRRSSDLDGVCWIRRNRRELKKNPGRDRLMGKEEARRFQNEDFDYNRLVQPGGERRGDFRTEPAAGTGAAGTRGPGADPLAGPALLRAGRRDPDRVRGGGAGVSRRPAADGPGGPLGPGAGGVGTGRGPLPVRVLHVLPGPADRRGAERAPHPHLSYGV